MTPSVRLRNSYLAALVVILLLAAFLRLHRIDNQSFWNDEGNSARLSERSLGLIIEGTASDVHPPLYYLLLRGWRELAGDTEFGLRSLSAFLGIGIIALSFVSARQLMAMSQLPAALTSTFLVAINPALIYYSQETRMYELLAFLALFSTYLFWRLLNREQLKLGIAFAYIGVTTAGLYTHYFFPAILLTHLGLLFVWLLSRDGWALQYSHANRPHVAPYEVQDNTRASRRRARWQDLRNLAVIMGVPVLLYLPWLPIFFRQIGGRSTSRPGPVPFLVDAFRWAAYGPTYDAHNGLIPLLAYLLLVVIGLLVGWKMLKRNLTSSVNQLLLVGIPLTMMWLLGATRPAYFKFLLVIVPPMAMLAGMGLWLGWSQLARRLPTMLVGITWALPSLALLFGAYQSVDNMYYDPNYYRDDYRSIARYIEENDSGDAAVILNAANQWEVFTYYHQNGAPVFPLPQGTPNPAVIDAVLSDITKRYDVIYVLFWGEGERDPEGLVESWLDKNAYKTTEDWVGDVRFVTYGSPATGTQATMIESDALFGDSIRLLSYSLSELRPSPGDILQITLTWETQAPIAKRYKVFIHMVDAGGEIIAQRDNEPGGGMAPTIGWQPNLEIIDNHGLLLPRSLSPGQYQLLLGLYDYEDPTLRLPVEVDGAIGDTLPLGSISVQAP